MLRCSAERLEAIDFGILIPQSREKNLKLVSGSNLHCRLRKWSEMARRACPERSRRAKHDRSFCIYEMASSNDHDYRSLNSVVGFEETRLAFVVLTELACSIFHVAGVGEDCASRYHFVAIPSTRAARTKTATRFSVGVRRNLCLASANLKRQLFLTTNEHPPSREATARQTNKHK